MRVNQTVENVYLRQDAVQLTRKYFWRLLGMAAIIYAVSTALDYLLTLLGDALMAPEIQSLLSAAEHYALSEKLTSADPLNDALTRLLTSPKYLLVNLVYFVVTGMIGSGMTLGRTLQHIDTGRGGVPRVLGVFSRMRMCLKAWGLSLWTGLKAFLWALPGLLVFIVGVEVSLYNHGGIGDLLAFAGIILAFVLVIQALLRYAMAVFLLADEPDRKIRDCVNFSKGLMKDRKRQLFKLGIPPMLKMLGIFFVFSIAGDILLFALGLTDSYFAVNLFGEVASLSAVYFLIQLHMVFALYYLKRREPAADAPVSYWLREHSEADTGDASPEEITPDTNHDTNEEVKENNHEQPDC